MCAITFDKKQSWILLFNYSAYIYISIANVSMYVLPWPLHNTHITFFNLLKRSMFFLSRCCCCNSRIYWFLLVLAATAIKKGFWCILQWSIAFNSIPSHTYNELIFWKKDTNKNTKQKMQLVFFYTFQLIINTKWYIIHQM